MYFIYKQRMVNIFSFVYAMHHFMFMRFLYVMHDKFEMFLFFHVSSFYWRQKVHSF
jgi:hypothetical protein